LFALSIAIGLLVRPYNEILPGFAEEVFGRGAEGFAALNAAAGLGALLSAVYLVFRGRAQGLVRIMLVSAVFSCLGLVAFTLTTNFTLALGALAFSALVLLAAHVGWMSLIQNVADPVMRGRIISFHVSVGLGTPALGALLLGWLAEMIGLRQALAATSLLALVIVLCILRPILRRAEEIEADPTS
jgi:MFS family permease